jgi:hypothetical protein
MRKIACLGCFIMLILVYSCSDKKELDGKWDDNIKLSARTVGFGSNADSSIITTEGEWWWITGVSVNNEHFIIPQDLNLQSDQYTLKNDYCVVERRNKNTIFIKAAANPNSAPRIITIELEAGDYFDYITVTQAAK